jgi:hypothetical protein
MPNQLSPLGVRGQILPLGIRRGGLSWYLSGGIAAANCIAAYQPKGAANLAASYINLANPGTYNAAPGTAPTWDVTSGWKFNGSSQYLTTGGIQPDNNQTWTFISRFSNITAVAYSGPICTSNTTKTDLYFLIPYEQNPPNKRRYLSGKAYVDGAAFTSSGIMALAGVKTYFNGSSDSADIATGTGGTQAVLWMGAAWNGASTYYYFTGYVQASAIYNATLTPAQISALTTAMNAL